MLAIPPSGASRKKALWRANIKPPVELVVGELKLKGLVDLVSMNVLVREILITYEPF